MPDPVHRPGEHDLAAHREPLLRLLERRLGSRELAEDAAQEAFEAAVRHLRDGRELQEPRAWLYTVALRRALDVLRSAAVRTAVPLHDGFLDVDADPHAVVATREQLEAVLAELRALPDRQRRALVMGAVDGASLAEIGVRLGAPQPVAKALVARARQTVRRRLAEREVDCGDVRADLREASRRGVRASAAAHRHMGTCAECAALGATLRRGSPRRTVMAGLLAWWPFATGPRAEGLLARLLPFVAGPGDASVALGAKACAAVCAGALVVGGVAGGGPVLPLPRDKGATARTRSDASDDVVRARAARPPAAGARREALAPATAAPDARPVVSRHAAPSRRSESAKAVVAAPVTFRPVREEPSVQDPAVEEAAVEAAKLEQMQRLFGCADADARCQARARTAAEHRRTTAVARRAAVERAMALRRRTVATAPASGPAEQEAPTEADAPPATSTSTPPATSTDAPAQEPAPPVEAAPTP